MQAHDAPQAQHETQYGAEQIPGYIFGGGFLRLPAPNPGALSVNDKLDAIAVSEPKICIPAHLPHVQGGLAKPVEIAADEQAALRSPA